MKNKKPDHQRIKEMVAMLAAKEPYESEEEKETSEEQALEDKYGIEKHFVPGVGKSSTMEEEPGYDSEDSPTYAEAKVDDPLAHEGHKPRLFSKNGVHIHLHMGKK